MRRVLVESQSAVFNKAFCNLIILTLYLINMMQL